MASNKPKEEESDPTDVYEMLLRRKAKREKELPTLTGGKRVAMITRQEDGLQQAAEVLEYCEADSTRRASNSTKSSYERLGGRHLAIVTAGSADAYLPSGATAPVNTRVELPDTVLLSAQRSGAENVLETITESGKVVNHGLCSIINQQQEIDRPPTVFSIKQSRRKPVVNMRVVDYETVFEPDDQDVDC
jgi:hypothetical protein